MLKARIRDRLPRMRPSPALIHQDKYKKVLEHTVFLNGIKIKVGSGNKEPDWNFVPGAFEDDMKGTTKAEILAFGKSTLKFADDTPN